MSRLSHLACLLVGIGVGLGVSYLLQGITISPEIVYIVLGTISIGSVFEGLSMLASYINYKRERRIKHSQKHIAPTLNDWFESPEVEEASVACPSPPQDVNIDSTELSSVNFREGRILVQSPHEPEHLDYFEETKEHLKKYPNIINFWTKAFNDAKKFTEKTQGLLQEIEGSLRNIFTEAEFTELNEEPEELELNMKFWIPWQNTWALYMFLLGKDTFRINIYFSQDGMKQGIEAGRGSPYFVSFDPSEVRGMVSKIKQLAPQFRKQIDEINELKTSVKYNLENFRRESHNLIKHIEADKPIKGKCNLCP